MRIALLATVLCVIASAARADGLPLKGGRYPGAVLVFSLTDEQKQVIDHFRTCHLENFKTMNEFTPYVFTLTPVQAKKVKAAKGFSPRVFEIYETYRGFNDAGPFWNLVLRFSENEIEVPLDLVLPDKKAKAAHAEQGWRVPNPCFPGQPKP